MGIQSSPLEINQAQEMGNSDGGGATPQKKKNLNSSWEAAVAIDRGEKKLTF